MNEQNLNSQKSVINPFTGLYNMQALKDEINNKNKCVMNNNFTVISMNINGLKSVNDHYGLGEGDELIKAAAWCASKALLNYGKIFRIGNDNFIALVEIPYSENIIDELKTMISEWRGKDGKTLSVSIGMVSHGEASGMPLNKLLRVAYGRMMKNKADYYITLGKSDDNSFPGWIYEENPFIF